MFAKAGLAIAATLLMTGMMAGAASADPIEGNWKTQHGSSAVIGPCGASFCIKLTSGEYGGKQIGTMTAAGKGSYTGTITKPSTGKTYSGSAKLTGTRLKMTGCVLAILCESQTWGKE